jgi:predicted N-acetyltransferase YhbS
MDIRPARAGDEDAVLAVVGAAFADATRDAGEELAIVTRTWATRRTLRVIELVADDEGAVVAHLQAAPGRLDGKACPVAGVAPVCVAPAAQGRGVGTALVRALLDAADDAGWPLLVLLGDPAYYGRFGFEPAARHGLHYAPAGVGNPHFQACRLGMHADRGADASAPTWRGEFSYCWEP